MKQNPRLRFELRHFCALALLLLSGVLTAWAIQGTMPGRLTPFAVRPNAAANLNVFPFALQQPLRSVHDWANSFNPAAGVTPRIMAMRGAGGQSVAPRRGRTFGPMVSVAIPATVSPPVRDLPAVNAYSAWIEQPEPRTPANRFPQLPRTTAQTDPVVQSAAAIAAMPAVGASFEGMNISNACGSCLPPDTIGAVGPNHYVQMVNSNFAVYSKAGAVLSPPKAINTLWSSSPNAICATHNNGDPVVLYDQLADRWLLSQFTVQSGTEAYAECIAVSQTSDPTGAYWLYEFDESADVFHDYPHLGVWPDGYYMSSNQFPNSTTGTSAAGAWAFERPKMLLGQAARYVFFDETPLVTNTYTPFGQLPTSLDGKTPPPAGAPNYFAEVDDVNTPNTPPAVGLHDEMRIWKFHVDWNNPANSTFGTGSTPPAPVGGFPGQYFGSAGNPDLILPIADFLASACQIENGPNDCTPEKLNPPQPPQYLDVLGDRLMFRLAYRNFGDHQSLVVNHTVDVVDQANAAGRNGVRWYEVRLGANPAVYQQGTFAPLDPTNPLWRWMGSAAMDHSGDLAIGYSASGPNTFPSLHYAGRLANDPLNDLTQGEAIMFTGLGIEANTGLFPYRNRWGDYSALTVDPNDDCTFWYTNEYLAANAITDILPVDWHTRIGSFRFPQCVSPASVNVVSAVSRKTHGGAVTFDVPLPLTGEGIEPRSGGASGNYQIVITFAAPVTFTGITTTCGSVSGSSTSGNDVTVNLTGVPNASRCSVGVDGVNGGGAATVPVNFLIGDVNADTEVNSGDASVTKAQSGQLLSNSNFREDVNVDGDINSGDTSVVKAKSGTALP